MKKTIIIPSREVQLAFKSENYYRLLKEKGIDTSQPYREIYGEVNQDIVVTGIALKIKPKPCGGVITTPYQKMLSRARINKRRWG